MNPLFLRYYFDTVAVMAKAFMADPEVTQKIQSFLMSCLQEVG